MNAIELLTSVKEKFLSVLGDTMIGFYVHGSVAFGCFSWECGDLDFLVVVTAEPTQEQKCALIRILLNADTSAPPKGFEMSVVTQDAVDPFLYPTPYVLHYSNAWRDAYRADTEAVCRSLNGTDPDLAAHITVCHAVGIPLYGKPITEVLGKVPPKDYLDSICLDIKHARQDIEVDPIYVILNLCRVLAYLRGGLVLSKAGGGAWGLAHLPAEFHPLISSAQAYYTDGVPFVCDIEQRQKFADYMLSEIF